MDEYVGVIKLFAGPRVPNYYLPCDGRVLSIIDNEVLFAVIGPAYGGDGNTTFALPKLESPLAGATYIICVNGIFPAWQ